MASYIIEIGETRFRASSREAALRSARHRVHATRLYRGGNCKTVLGLSSDSYSETRPVPPTCSWRAVTATYYWRTAKEARQQLGVLTPVVIYRMAAEGGAR